MDRHIGMLALVAIAALILPSASYASIMPPPISLPEPTTLALLGVGAGAVGVVAWVKGRRKK